MMPVLSQREALVIFIAEPEILAHSWVLLVALEAPLPGDPI